VTCPECEQEIRVPKPRQKQGSIRLGEERTEAELTLGDWLVCIFLPCVGVVTGFVRLAQGKATGGTMIGCSVLFAFLWLVVNLGVIALRASMAR